MKALITGATGFVGSHLCEHLLGAGDLVLGCSRSGAWPDEYPESLREVPLFQWDVVAGLSDEVQERVADFAPDVIYHLAAISVPADCGADQPTFSAIRTNVEGTRSVIKLATSLVRPPRVVFASSCYVYGPVSSEQPRVTEDTPCRPVHGYGITKLAAEKELLEAGRNHRLDVVIARAFQHSGPRQSAQMVLPDWAQQLASGTDPIHAICLDTYLDISDVRDIVRAYRELAIAGHSNSVYNVGSGVCRRAGDLLDMMLEISRARTSVIELSPGRRQHPIADITRLSNDTGWRPLIPIEDTLSEILRYWEQQEKNK